MAAAENVALKDEVDALRETAAKAAALEATVASYKKRMEEHVDLRRQVNYINCLYFYKQLEKIQILCDLRIYFTQLLLTLLY